MVRRASKPESVVQAKQQLREAAARVRYLDVVRHNPVPFIGAALAGGWLLSRLLKSGKGTHLLRLGIDSLRKPLP